MKPYSITHRLIATILLVELLAALSISGAALAYERHVRFRSFDVMLRGRADSLLGAVQDAEDPEDNVTVDPTELVLPRQDAYEVLSPPGRVLGTSPSASADVLANLSSAHKPGYFGFKVNGASYRALRFDGIRVIDRNERNGGLRRPVTVLYAAPTHGLWEEVMEAVGFYVATGALLLAITGVALVW